MVVFLLPYTMVFTPIYRVGVYNLHKIQNKMIILWRQDILISSVKSRANPALSGIWFASNKENRPRLRSSYGPFVKWAARSVSELCSRSTSFMVVHRAAGFATSSLDTHDLSSSPTTCNLILKVLALGLLSLGRLGRPVGSRPARLALSGKYP